MEIGPADRTPKEAIEALNKACDRQKPGDPDVELHNTKKGVVVVENGKIIYPPQENTGTPTPDQ